jgi:hypothetical protein
LEICNILLDLVAIVADMESRSLYALVKALVYMPYVIKCNEQA